MTRSAIDKDRLIGEATEWLARLNGDKVGPTTRSHFIQWLTHSYLNVDAFLTVSLVLAEVSFVKAMPSVEELARAVHEEPKNSNVIHLRPTHDELEDAEASSLRRIPRRSLFKYAAAASVVGLAGSLGLLAFRPWAGGKSISTAVGEQSSFALEDGSTVHLNTDTALTVRLEKASRRITLTRGEARFEVAKDRHRPFVVTTPQALVRALGTTFNVRILDEQTVVSVIEGHIRVVKREDGAAETLMLSTESRTTAASAAAVDLLTNGQISVTEAGPMQTNGGPPFDRAVGWTQRHIFFDDEPLEVLVAEFNRYSKQPLEIGDPALAKHRIYGSFDAFDRASLLEYLRRYQGVAISEEHGKLVMRGAPGFEADR
jgi:transmembrane sensor